MMDKLLSLLDGLDIVALLPEVDTILGKLSFAMRICLLIGPIIMLVLGLIYLLIPPKEANYKAGFRTYWGMGSIQAWRFTQWLAGIVFSALGLILMIVMLVISSGFMDMGEMDIITTSVTCLLWQVGLAFASYLGVAITVCVLFDRTGTPRRKKKSSARV